MPAMIGWPMYSDPNAVNPTSLSGGSWQGTLPLTNLQQRRSDYVARSTNTSLQSTRFAVDLKTLRRIGCFALPRGHTISLKGNVRFLAQVTALLFDYEAGDDITALGGTFARASTATYMDSAGLLWPAANGVPRDGHFIGGVRHILLEQSRTNLCLQSENFGTTWTASSAPTRVAANQTFGSLVLDLVGDASAVALSFYQQAITYTGDAAKAFAIFFTQGTSTSSAFAIKDQTAVAYRLWGTITWTGSAPTVTMTNGTLLKLETWGTLNGTTLYRALCVSTTVTAANTNVIQILPASDAAGTVGLTGTINFGGVQTENALTPSSYMPTAAATFTRIVDSLQFPVGFLPQALTMYESHVDLGTQSTTTGSYATLGSWAGAGGFSLTSYSAAPGQFDAAEHNGTTQINAGAASLAVALGDLVETRTTVSAAGVLQANASKNGGAEVSGATNSQPLPATWGGAAAILRLNDRSSSAGLAAFRSVRVMAGSAQSRAAMQAAVYDSGWLPAWPQVFPTASIPSNDPRAATGKFAAEDLLTQPAGLTHVPASPIVAQYCSVQIDDSTNAAGYVDLARLAICGGFTPSINMEYGVKLGVTTATIRNEMFGGATIYDERPQRRTAVFALNNLPEDEALANIFDMFLRAGIAGQFMWIYDTLDTYHMGRRSFLATLKELSALEAPYFGRSNIPLAAVEEL